MPDNPTTCAECRRVCSLCKNPEKENEIVFCQRCDRGFHTFCVGLKQLPRLPCICEMFWSDFNVRYQKLAEEHTQLQTQTEMLREEVSEKQKKMDRLAEELESKEAVILRFQAENESFSFRNDRVARPVDTFRSAPSKKFLIASPTFNHIDQKVETLEQERKLEQNEKSELAENERQRATKMAEMCKEDSEEWEEVAKLTSESSKEAVIRRLQNENESLKIQIDQLARLVEMFQSEEREETPQSGDRFSYWNFLPPEIKYQCIKNMDFKTRWLIRGASTQEKSLSDEQVIFLECCKLTENELRVEDEYGDQITEGVNKEELGEEVFNQKVESFLTHVLPACILKNLDIDRVSEKQLLLISNIMEQDLDPLLIDFFGFYGRRETDFQVGISILKKCEDVRMISFMAFGGKEDIECPIEEIFSLEQVINVEEELSMNGFADHCILPTIKKWSLNEMQIGSKLRTDDNYSMEEIREMFEDREVSSNDTNLRIKTNHPDKHIILIWDLDSLEILIDVVAVVIPSNLEESEYKLEDLEFE